MKRVPTRACAPSGATHASGCQVTVDRATTGYHKIYAPTRPSGLSIWVKQNSGPNIFAGLQTSFNVVCYDVSVRRQFLVRSAPYASGSKTNLAIITPQAASLRACSVWIIHIFKHHQHKAPVCELDAPLALTSPYLAEEYNSVKGWRN